jgi:hypothetical protein
MNDAGGGGFVIEEESTYDESAYNEPPPGCRECGCLSFDHEYWKAYKVMVRVASSSCPPIAGCCIQQDAAIPPHATQVCVHCKRIDKYRQVPKGQVKDIFLLTDGGLPMLLVGAELAMGMLSWKPWCKPECACNACRRPEAPGVRLPPKPST